MEKSENINELAKALSAAQSEMPGVTLNAVNPFLKNKYADLGAVVKTVSPVLSKHGLSFSQLVSMIDNNVGLDTILMHESGQWLSSFISLPLGEEKGKSLAQSVGSIITYLRRYSLSAILGIYSEEDADANSRKKTTQEKELTHEEKERTDLVAKILKLGTELGGAKDEKVAAIFRKYTPSLNPNKITDLSDIKKLHADLISYKGEKK